jgi:ribosome biogenesis GTPase A
VESENNTDNRQILESKTLADLQIIAKNFGVTSVTKYKKSDLINKIIEITSPPAVNVSVGASPEKTITIQEPVMSAFNNKSDKFPG